MPTTDERLASLEARVDAMSDLRGAIDDSYRLSITMAPKAVASASAGRRRAPVIRCLLVCMIALQPLCRNAMCVCRCEPHLAMVADDEPAGCAD